MDIDNARVHDIVLSYIPLRRRDAITSNQLMQNTGLSFRRLKQIITELREFHPIVSRETEGGGYWLAESISEVREFMRMLDARREGLTKTINLMSEHIYGFSFKK